MTNLEIQETLKDLISAMQENKHSEVKHLMQNIEDYTDAELTDSQIDYLYDMYSDFLHTSVVSEEEIATVAEEIANDLAKLPDTSAATTVFKIFADQEEHSQYPWKIVIGIDGRWGYTTSENYVVGGNVNFEYRDSKYHYYAIRGSYK